MIWENLLAETPGYKELTQPEDIVIQQFAMARDKDFDANMEAFYVNTLKNLSSGVTALLIHPAFDDAEMQAIAVDHPYYGAKWRQMDFDFFSSELCKQIIQEENIQLITWKEIGKLIKK